MPKLMRELRTGFAESCSIACQIKQQVLIQEATNIATHTVYRYMYQSTGYGLFGIVNSFERPEIELMRHRTREVKQGDVIAVPAGRPSWLYNNGRRPLVFITFSRDIRRYFLGGDPRGPNGANINVFSGFSEEPLANAFNASNTVIRTIQGLNDLRGSIVRAQIALSSMADDDEEQEKHNIGLGNIQVIENIENPLNTLVYNPQAGRININAMLGPYTIINANSVLYIIRGGGRVQIVGATRQPVFNGLVRSSEVMVILQGSAVIIQAGTRA
ncbi:hypothetical protein Syun_030021 [Stephania yunnanensis]|uniref:Cupin type-1 domain-containing protein n=1 Tax=Stephania yunnanensis TaxID=152371 RepID=A0AAP0HK38_9MAGN